MAAKNYISTLDMTHEEWLERRFTTIGASEIGDIIGVGFKSPRQRYYAKINREVVEDNANMEWGRDLEDFLQSRYEKNHPDHKVQRDNKIRFDKGSPRFTVNLDRTISTPEGRGLLELKTTTSYAMKHWDGEVPLSYVAQVQWGLMITGYQFGVLGIGVLDKREFNEMRFERDEDFIKFMRKEADAFLTYLDTKTEPPALLIDVETMTNIDPVTAVEATEEDKNLIPLYQAAQNAESIAKATKEEIAEKIKMRIGDKAALVSGETILATYKVIKKKSFVMPESEYRSFSVKKEKAEKSKK